RPPAPSLFPYTTLFRSERRIEALGQGVVGARADRAARQGQTVPARSSGEAVRAVLTAVVRVENRPSQAAAFTRGRVQGVDDQGRSEEHTSELQSREKLV